MTGLLSRNAIKDDAQTKTIFEPGRVLLTSPGKRRIVGGLMPEDAGGDEALTTALAGGSFIRRCAWCDRYALEHSWKRYSDDASFLRLVSGRRVTHTICDECARRLQATGLSH